MYVLVVLATPCCNDQHTEAENIQSSHDMSLVCQRGVSTRRANAQNPFLLVSGHITEVWITSFFYSTRFSYIKMGFGQTPAAAAAGLSSGCWLGFNDKSCF